MTGIGIRGFKGLEEGESTVRWEVQRGFFKRGGDRGMGWEGFGEEGKRREFWIGAEKGRVGPIMHVQSQRILSIKGVLERSRR